MTYQSGNSISYYILDISDAERKAAQLRSLYQGIRQDAASLSTPVIAQVNGSNTQAQVSALAKQTAVTATAQSATQLLIATTVELGAAAGKTTEQINNELAALSRDALAAGDLVAANELIDASLGIMAEQLTVVAVGHEKATISAEAQANAELRLAQTQARELKASGDSVAALQLLTNARNNATNASEQAIATANVQIAGLEKSATATGAFNAQLGSLLNPVLLVTAALGAGVAVVHQFSDALEFKANLDELIASNKLLLQGTRNTTVAFRDATEFADKYKLTQQETNEAISESIPVIRQSTSNMEDILSVFTRLTILKPGKTFNDASRAIGELQAGNVVSLERIFNILPDDANRMKKEIEGGADAVQVLSKYLNDVGVGTRALELRAQGLKGAYRDAANEAENLKKAEADLAASHGALTVTKTETGFIQALTADLSGTGDLAGANRVFLSVLLKTGDLTQALDEKAKFLTASMRDQAAAATSTSGAIYRSADADDRLASSANNAAIYVDKLTTAQYAQNKASLEDQRIGERSAGLFDNLNQLTSFKDKQHDAAKQQYDDNQQRLQDAKDLQNAELSYASATNNTARQRQILNDQLKAAKGNAVEELNIKSQLAQLDKQKESKPTKGLTGLDRTDIKLAGDYQDQLTEVNRRLKDGHLTQQQRNQLLLDQIDLQNKINDAVQKEKDLQIGIGLDQVHNQQKNIEEARELSGLHHAENDSRFSAAQQQAIRLREQEILLDQQKRSNDLTKEQAELEKTVKLSGKDVTQGATGLSQGVFPASQVPPIGSGLPTTPQGAIPVSFAQGTPLTINLTVNVDKDGIPTAIQTDPSVALNLMANAFSTLASSGRSATP